nr:hypothetical protein [Candidatus Sigynarchaeum springense]
MMPFETREHRCVHCHALLEPGEARAADEILARLCEEAFWETIDAMGPPDLHYAIHDALGFSYPRCLGCVTKAIFSLVIAPGGHAMLG